MKKSTLDKILPLICLVLIFFVGWLFYCIYYSEKEEISKPVAENTNYKLTYSPNGKFIILTDDKLLRVFEVESGKNIQEIIINGNASLAFSPDSQSVSLIDKDKKIQTITLNENKIIKTIEFK